MKEVLLKVTGKVQGVFYRAHAQEKALGLGLAGYAHNLPDGAVEILLQGSENAIKQFINWAHDGSPGAKVNQVKATRQKVDHQYRDFQIS